MPGTQTPFIFNMKAKKNSRQGACNGLFPKAVLSELESLGVLEKIERV